MFHRYLLNLDFHTWHFLSWKSDSLMAIKTRTAYFKWKIKATHVHISLSDAQKYTGKSLPQNYRSKCRKWQLLSIPSKSRRMPFFQSWRYFETFKYTCPTTMQKLRAQWTKIWVGVQNSCGNERAAALRAKVMCVCDGEKSSAHPLAGGGGARGVWILDGMIICQTAAWNLIFAAAKQKWGSESENAMHN